MMDTTAVNVRLAHAGRRNRKAASFIAQLIIHSNELEFDDGEQGNEDIVAFLEEIGMPKTYLHQVRSILRVRTELLREDYILITRSELNGCIRKGKVPKR